MSESPPPEAGPPPKAVVPRYSGAAAVAPVRRPFAYQAAQYAFWAPLVAIALAFCAPAVLNRPEVVSVETLRYVNLGLGYLNLFIIASALVMGIVALLAMRRHGRKELLFRGLLGVLFSTILAGAMGWNYFHAPPTIGQLLVGEWTTTSSAPGGKQFHSRLIFNTDGTAHWQIPDNSPPIDIPGRWEVAVSKTAQKVLLLKMTFDKLADPKPPFPGRIWQIEKIEKTRMKLIDITGTAMGGNPVPEDYEKAPAR